MTGDSTNSLNVTAFANTDGTHAIQVINNGNNTETVTLEGLSAPGHGHGRAVRTWLTNQAHNLTEGYAFAKHGSWAAEVPGKSLLSFVV